MKLYRYRTIKSALRELDNGSFYFAAPTELNDPIEGYLKIFWQGDAPAWEGLLKNFVCSFFYGLQTYLLVSGKFYAAQENFLSDLHNKILLPNLHQFDNSPLSRTFAELGENFLTANSVQKVVEFYGNDEIKCYGREMEFILRTVTDDACRLCVQRCKDLSLIRGDFDENFFDVEYEISFAELKGISDAERKRRIDEIENLNCDLMESGLLALKLNHRSSTAAEYTLKQRLLWLRFIFPRLYVEQLKEIMYPNGYVVCFSDTPTNSAMWGNYADNHCGVCFAYETETLDGREFIHFAAKSLEVKPIKYSSQFITRNFFDTLRHLKFIRVEDWLTGKGGVKSYKLDDETAGEYDEDYHEKFYNKLTDWNHEHEYRIFLSDRFYRYGDKFARKLRYNPNALTGIIFGLRTTLDDKLKLIQKLDRLGKTVANFDFLQAEFDDETQVISVREKTLLTKIT